MTNEVMATDIGLPTFEVEVSCASYCYGGVARFHPTELPRFTSAEDVWVKGDAVAAELAALRARVAELEADAERLNWLQANPRLSTIRLAGESDRECYMYAVAGAPGLKLREIIDAARLSGNKPPQCFSTEGDDRR